MPRNILVVDDDAQQSEILKTLLELDGHSVRVARNGGQAISLMRERLAAFLLIDDDLPDFAGSFLALHLKALAETMNPKLGCIAIAIRGDVIAGEAIDGFDHVLCKPVAYEQIADLLAITHTGPGASLQ